MRVYAFKYKDFFDRLGIKYTMKVCQVGNFKEIQIVVDDKDFQEAYRE